MGQRSQIYVRYNNGNNLFAEHLQWNWGEYMIDRAEQLMKFIKENLDPNESYFLSNKYFDIINNSRQDIDILQSLSQLNINKGSFVRGCDLVKESLYCERFEKEPNYNTFKMTPEMQDNNNGILVIDIKDNGTIKYGFAIGSEDMDRKDLLEWYKADDNGTAKYKMCSAKDYIERFSPERWSEKYKKSLGKNEFNLAKANYYLYWNKALELDKENLLLTQEEYNEIFDKEYSYQDCMKENEFKETIEENEKYRKENNLDQNVSSKEDDEEEL